MWRSRMAAGWRRVLVTVVMGKGAVMAVMTVVKTLEQACVLHESVFGRATRNTVYGIDDLEIIDPASFFAENYVTDGMKILLSEAFKRLEGKLQNASGTFLPSQSMGGGKTHNLRTAAGGRRHGGDWRW